MTPLEGIRILDLCRYAPGPYATLICAALGANVVKVEAPPDGDPLRALDPVAFERLNAGKRSVLLDLKSSEGITRFWMLVRSAHVLVESFRPGVMERLGIGFEHVSREVPAMIYVSISGYGRSGPRRDRAGHDVNYMARTGALHGALRPLPLQVADFAAGGLYAVISILAARMEGRGRHIDLSMERGVASMMMLGDGQAGDVLSGRYPSYSVYRTSDGQALSVGALEPKFWQNFCTVLERPDLVARKEDPGARDEVAVILASQSAAEWESRFRSTDACVERVVAPTEALESSRAYELPFAAAGRELGAAPELGEHNEEILRGLG